MAFFEKLYVYKISKSKLLRELDGVKNLKKFAEGNRGVIYKGFLNKKKICVKAVSKKSGAKNSIRNEGKWLKILNKKGIGPCLLKAKNDYFIYEFVEGQHLNKYLEQNSKDQLMKVLKCILKQCRTLDNLKVNKQEMLRPHKHVIIGKKIVLIDFERCKTSEKPKNTTQFCQYILNNSKLLEEKDIKIRKEHLMLKAKKYKDDQNNENFKDLMSEIK